MLDQRMLRQYHPIDQRTCIWFPTAVEAERYIKLYSPGKRSVAVIWPGVEYNRQQWDNFIVHITCLDASVSYKALKHLDRMRFNLTTHGREIHI